MQAELKTIIQSLVISFMIHVIYIVGTVVVGYIKTRNYKPDIENNRGSNILLDITNFKKTDSLVSYCLFLKFSG